MYGCRIFEGETGSILPMRCGEDDDDDDKQGQEYEKRGLEISSGTGPGRKHNIWLLLEKENTFTQKTDTSKAVRRFKN